MRQVSCVKLIQSARNMFICLVYRSMQPSYIDQCNPILLFTDIGCRRVVHLRKLFAVHAQLSVQIIADGFNKGWHIQ